MPLRQWTMQLFASLLPPVILFCFFRGANDITGEPQKRYCALARKEAQKRQNSFVLSVRRHSINVGYAILFTAAWIRLFLTPELFRPAHQNETSVAGPRRTSERYDHRCHAPSRQRRAQSDTQQPRAGHHLPPPSMP